MAEDFDRRRRERYDRLEEFIEETEEDLDEEEPTGTFEDLIVDDRFFTETGTLTVTDEDFPIETGANPLPFPWQGIRRVGAVLNFNYVWDDTAGEWVRQKKTDGLPDGVDLISIGCTPNTGIILVCVADLSSDLDLVDVDPAITADETNLSSSVAFS